MSSHLESLETRTLFAAAVSATIQDDYNAAVADGTAITAAVKAGVATFKADAKTIAADVKGLGKSKTNASDLAAVNKAVAAATALANKDSAKLYAAGKTDLTRAKAAFLADAAKPTARNLTKLNAALDTLATGLDPLETALHDDLASGEAAIDGDLNTLIAANPSATALQTHGTTTVNDQTTANDQIIGDVNSLNDDISALVTAVTG
jgi:hypothetical protein